MLWRRTPLISAGSDHGGKRLQATEGGSLQKPGTALSLHPGRNRNSYKHQELNSNSNSREQETDSPLVIPERHETYQHIDFSLARAVPDL